ncbi:MAG: GTP cyclohydrolase FolE2 [Bdellovibrionaceae bacterium]|nr:GTP cyclohydrolase FolE2 [Pseudobdellovibrionaceae bacterium]
MSKESMPDVTNLQKANVSLALDWVGMGAVEVLLNHSEGSQKFNQLPAIANIFVNLKNPSAKGIHMSRVYLLATRAFESNTLTLKEIKTLLADMVESQGGVSDKARISLEFSLPAKRKALMSDLAGLRHYPIRMEWELSESGEVTQVLDFKVLYSSTCPCSAALARQLIKKQWESEFSDRETVSVADVAQWLTEEKSIAATPHAQRSVAHLRLKIQDGQDLQIMPFVDLIEGTLKTPVQTAVKREDEQEFARLNGQNLMFCEDAARKIYSALSSAEGIQDFWLRVEHLESLHAHNAVSEVSKFGVRI